MQRNSAEIQFHKLLHVLASQSNYQLNEMTIALYDEALSEFGYENVLAGLKKIFLNRKGGDRFPSVADIRNAMGVDISPRTFAVDCANLIFWAFSTYRLNYCEREDFAEQFQAKVGQMPWNVIERMGGYRSLYNEWNEGSDRAVLRAQVRDAAMATFELGENLAQFALEISRKKQLGGKCD